MTPNRGWASSASAAGSRRSGARRRRKLVLEPNSEADIEPCSNGFRAGAPVLDFDDCECAVGVDRVPPGASLSGHENSGA
jgi:hypothetical protein